MSATTQRSAVVGEAAGARISGRRLSTESKAAFKTTEFMAYLAMLVGLLSLVRLPAAAWTAAASITPMRFQLTKSGCTRRS